MKKVLSLVGLVVVFVVAWFFGSPYYTVYQLKNAYDTHNADKINAHIDFASVQTAMKHQLNPILVKKVQTLTQSPLAKLLNVQVDEQTMVEKLVTQAVDNAVTPDSIKTVMTTQGNVSNLNPNVKLLGGLTAVAMDKIKLNPQTLTELATAQNTEELNQKLLAQLKASALANGEGSKDDKPTANYCGINCFTVQTQVQGYPLTIQMQRQGFSTWKVVKVKLPI